MPRSWCRSRRLLSSWVSSCCVVLRAMIGSSGEREWAAANRSRTGSIPAARSLSGVNRMQDRPRCASATSRPSSSEVVARTSKPSCFSALNSSASCWPATLVRLISELMTRMGKCRCLNMPAPVAATAVQCRAARPFWQVGNPMAERFPGPGSVMLHPFENPDERLSGRQSVNWDLQNPFIENVQVQPEDIDELGHANNAVYVQWLERCAWQHSKARGLGLPEYQQLNRAMVVMRHEIDYLAAAYEGEELQMATWIVSWDSKLRMTRRFQLVRPADGVTLL